ncbi:hypothetical protein [Enterococcus sp.]|uniref:hypothetical protein n=1 Tax=Enterococcus sp. TaxID=35783 RepID=UPI000ECCC8BE|nr:hypothetical protein [Enterococcus sp.]HCM87953.1 hypothetical protein [Enterococcus sp.]
MIKDDYTYDFSIAEKTSKEEIMDTFSTRTMSILARGVQQAYRWTNNWLKDPGNAILVSYEWEKYTRGYVVGIAVNYFIIKELLDEDLDLNFSFKYNSNKSYPYLVINDGKGEFELTINQTQKGSRCASKSRFRDNLIDKYQSSLFEIDREDEIQSKNYFQLTHGYQTVEPGFVNLGIPSKNGYWKDYIDISQLPQVNQSNVLKTKVSEYQAIDLTKMQNYINEVVENE